MSRRKTGGWLRPCLGQAGKMPVSDFNLFNVLDFRLDLRSAAAFLTSGSVQARGRRATCTYAALPCKSSVKTRRYAVHSASGAAQVAGGRAIGGGNAPCMRGFLTECHQAIMVTFPAYISISSIKWFFVK